MPKPVTAKKATIGKLSHSSAQTLMGCEQKYVFYKVENREPDPDYTKSDSLAIGSAFHKILELSKHEKPKSITSDLKLCAEDKDILLKEEDFPLVHAMVLKYLRLHNRLGLKVLGVEPEIENETTRGFIDAVMEDGEGKWWIVDLKTFKAIFPGMLASLPRDPQLNLYAGLAAVVSEKLGLPLKKFAGCRYRITTKTTAKRKKGEEYLDYVKRLLNQYVKSYDIALGFGELDPESRLDIHDTLYKKSKALGSGKVKPLRNFGHCMNYFSPCQYWSQCHGATYSKMSETMESRVILED